MCKSGSYKNKLDWHLLEKVGAFLIKHSPNRFPKYEAISGENTKGETLLIDPDLHIGDGKMTFL